MNRFLQDVQYGLRTLARSPGFAAVAILTLALGIGANTAIFSFVNGILLKPLPYPHAERIVRVLEKPPGGGRNGISTLTYLDWVHQNTVFDYMAAQTGSSVTLSGAAEPVQLHGAMVSPHYFDIFGITPSLGRTFSGDEDQPGKNRVAVLANALWRTQFGADPHVIGRKIILDGVPTEIVGVLPAMSAYDRAFAQIWQPLTFEPSNMTRNFHWFGALAILKPGVSLEQARTQMDAIGARISQDFPDSNKDWGVTIDRFADISIGQQLRTTLYVFLAAVGMVLLIACVNVANLTLARGAAREREIAIRFAMGAGRARLIGQLLTESALLAACGGAEGIALGYAMMRGLNRIVPPFSLPREATIEIDARVLLFALAVSLLTGLLFGLVPAIQASRADLAGVMKEGGRGSTSGGARSRFRSTLVVVEIALAFVLLSGSGLLIRSFFDLQSVNTGFDSTNVLTMGLPISTKAFPDPARLNDYFGRVSGAIESLPGVRNVALTSALPLEGWGAGMPFQIADEPVKDRANRPACFFKVVTPSYFMALSIPIHKGRGLSESDVAGGPPVAVINETMARRYFKEKEPVGKRILIQEMIPGKTALGPEIAWEVVGISADEKINGLDDMTSGGVYISNLQSPNYYMSLVVRGALDPSRFESALRRAVYGVNKNQALTDVKTLEEIKAQSVTPDRLRMILLAVFAAVALLLSGIGIYGVISYSVVQRTHEIGIRAALGAEMTQLIWLVLRKGMILAGIGLAIGLAGSLGMTRVLSNLLFGVSPRDPWTLAMAGISLVGAAALACYIPARRASKVDPLIALRYE